VDRNVKNELGFSVDIFPLDWKDAKLLATILDLPKPSAGLPFRP
jgi:hypothetical protein